MSKLLLVIGNKNYSSWSLRGWLAVKKSGAEFKEQKLSLDTPAFEAGVPALSPTRQVPVLWHDSLCIWDSLAIAEYANEQFAHGSLWPADPCQRALARSVCAEMHSGFSTLRRGLPMNCRARNRTLAISSELEADISRICSIWAECRQARTETGDWLFGRFSIADAMFAPVALRFNSYCVELPAIARDYVQVVVRDPEVAAWMQEGRAEEEVIENEEVGVEV